MNWNTLKIIKYNIRLMTGLNLLVGIAYILLIPFWFSFKLIDTYQIAKASELFISIVGILLLPYITMVEKYAHVEEIILSKRFKYVHTFFIRLVFIIFLMGSLILIILIYAKLNEGTFPFAKIFLGTLVTSIYLGLFGMTVCNLLNNLPIGYMISFAYYLFEFSTKGEYTHDIYLFSMLNNSYTEKINLIVLSLLMVCINVIIVHLKSKNVALMHKGP